MYVFEKLNDYVWKEFSINVCDKLSVYELTEIEKKRSFTRMGWEYIQEPIAKKKKKTGSAYADFSYEDGADLDDDDDRRKASYSDDDGDVYKAEHDEDDDDERDDFDDGEEFYEEEEDNATYGRNPKNKGIGRGNAGPRGPGSRGGTSHLKKGSHVTARGGGDTGALCTAKDLRKSKRRRLKISVMISWTKKQQVLV